MEDAKQQIRHLSRQMETDKWNMWNVKHEPRIQLVVILWWILRGWHVEIKERRHCKGLGAEVLRAQPPECRSYGGAAPRGAVRLCVWGAQIPRKQRGPRGCKPLWNSKLYQIGAVLYQHILLYKHIHIYICISCISTIVLTCIWPACATLQYGFNTPKWSYLPF